MWCGWQVELRFSKGHYESLMAIQGTHHEFSSEDIVIIPSFDILPRHFTNARSERFHLYRQEGNVSA